MVLQVTDVITQSETNMSLFDLVVKGGWIMIPLFVLLLIAVFVMADAWAATNRLKKFNRKWFNQLIDLIYKKNIDHATVVAKKSDSALGKMAIAGLQSYDLPLETIQEDMQVAVRQTVAKSEGSIGYLSMIAAIAPMLGFLGTIFGVIQIFINISLTNDFSIASISDGLYQKMICSGAGLLVGIIAYVGYYILNRRIDLIMLLLDGGGNELMKAITASRRQQ